MTGERLDDELAVEMAAVRLLANREHGRAELRLKLARRFDDPVIVDRVLDDLERRRLLNDERFATAYVEQRAERGFGPVRIGAELRERGIEAALITAVLDAAGIDWRQRLGEAARRRFGDCGARDRGELGRRGRFLSQRGFPTDLVSRYLGKLGVEALD